MPLGVAAGGFTGLYTYSFSYDVCGTAEECPRPLPEPTKLPGGGVKDPGTLEGFIDLYLHNFEIQNRTTLNRIQENVESAGDFLYDHGTNLLTDPLDELGRVKDGVVNTASSIKDGVVAVANDPVGAVSSAVGGVIDTIDQVTSDPVAAGNLNGDFLTNGPRDAIAGSLFKAAQVFNRARRTPDLDGKKRTGRDRDDHDNDNDGVACPGPAAAASFGGGGSSAGGGGASDCTGQAQTAGAAQPQEATKPKHAPNIEKWKRKGGEVTENGDGSLTYTDWDGTSVTYRDGFPDFEEAGLVRQSAEINQKGNYTTDFADADRSAPLGPKLDENTWHHHEDLTTMQEIDRIKYRRFTHQGGVSIGKGGA